MIPKTLIISDHRQNKSVFLKHGVSMITHHSKQSRDFSVAPSFTVLPIKSAQFMIS